MGFGRKKSKKLIDTGLESRFEEIGDNANCITKFFVMMRGKNYFIFSLILSMLNLAVIFTFFTFNKVKWLNNNITLDTWIFDVGIMTYYVVYCLILCCSGKKNYCTDNNNKNTDCWSAFKNLIIKGFILFILLGSFYTNILSFYAVYYSFKGHTFFYYYCYDAESICSKLFKYGDEDWQDNYSPFEYEQAQKLYYYYKIYLKKGKTGIFILSLILRIIMFIWVVTTIANILYFSNLIGPLKTVIYFIKNADGTITDLDDINIIEEEEESDKGFTGNNKAETEEDIKDNKNIKSKKKSILLKQVFNKKNIDNNLNNNINSPNKENENNIPYNNQVRIINNNLNINNNQNNFIVNNYYSGLQSDNNMLYLNFKRNSNNL